MSEQPPKPNHAPRVSKRQRWHPPEYEKEDIRAMQALAIYATGQGEPPSSQDVRRALDWIVYRAAGTYDEPFIAGQPDVKDYLLGRRSVGLAIIKLINLKPEVITE
jgi:hypothetical protein